MQCLMDGEVGAREKAMADGIFKSGGHTGIAMLESE